MVVLAASICTRGGKPVLSRQFREIARSRVEALLASFPKLADSGTQHTTVEQDNVRYVYQPLEELYMVLITNRQSNILQDIDSLHLFAQVVTSICKSLEEREILRNAYELLSAFDEVVTLGYRENSNLTQIKAFLEMESHEERIQEIISRNKELEATEERKRKAKQLEMQRKEMAKAGRGQPARTPNYPTYTPPARSNVPDTYDSYEAEKNRTFKASAPKGKGMQLGKKNKTSDMYSRVRDEFGSGQEDAPLVAPTEKPAPASTRASLEAGRDPIAILVEEKISAVLTRDGNVKSFGIKGDLQLRIADPALTKIRLELSAPQMAGAVFRTHPHVDKAAFNASKAIQLRDASKGFPTNNAVGVLRWTAGSAKDAADLLPVSFTVWVNGEPGAYNVTVEYELTNGGGDEGAALSDVAVSMPFASAEPQVSSFDAVYEVGGDSIEWNIGPVDEGNASGSFEFEAQADDEGEFFPMRVSFRRAKPLVDVDVTTVKLVEMGEEVTFSKAVNCVADSYLIE